ncbi:iron complex outermembrane receptor protein [Nitrospirillum amazonense]|uniref:Iron complex outermembrane receptor protein n=2 Tax=Nitrospirillum amazonense TaxID=28077 RepID=A0A560EL61_9PROT|nr:iron complex outermembrane receptor protein [Nitrospirillum amazonense]
MKGHSGFRFFCAATAAYLMLQPVARAAEDPAPAIGDTLDEITVTAQKQQYVGTVPAKDVPQNVQTLSGATLQEVGITRLADALDLVSGVARQNSYGGLWDGFAVRGFAGDINVPSGFLVNGFNYGRGFGGTRDVSGVERIDVLKGPTSALFGRGEPGGTVNIITKQPQFTPEGSVMLEGGSYSHFRGEADYTTPLSKRLAVRMNGAFEDEDSFRDTVHARKETVSPSVLWFLNDTTSVSYQFAYTHQEVPFDRGVVAVNGKLGVIPISRFLGEPADGPTKTNDYGHQLQLQHDFSDKWGVLLGAGYRTTDLTGYGETPELVASRQPFFTDGRTLSRQRRYTTYDTEDLVLRGEINGQFDTFGITHHVLVGADYDDFKFNNFQTRSRPPALSTHPTFAQQNAIDIYNPVYTPAGLLPATTGLVFNQYEQDKTTGTYVQDQIDVTDSIKLRVGARYDDFSQSILDRAAHVTARQNPDSFSPQAGIVYEPTKSISVYFSYGQGFRANTGQDYYGTPFAPERTESYEIGAKYVSPDQGITSSIALFKMSKDNIITADPVHSGYVIAIGTAESKGVEFDVSAKLPYDFRLLGSFAYVDAYSTSSVLDPDFGKVVAVGDPLINIPELSGNLILFKDFSVMERPANVGIGVNYVDKRLGETGTTFTLPAYTLVRLMGSVHLTDDIELSGEINNLFDETWYANSYAALWVQPGAPRTFKARVRYKF